MTITRIIVRTKLSSKRCIVARKRLNNHVTMYVRPPDNNNALKYGPVAQLRRRFYYFFSTVGSIVFFYTWLFDMRGKVTKCSSYTPRVRHILSS